MSWLTEFLKAYDDVPSQDNEGYTPDRGAFKCGFSKAWHSQQTIIYQLTAERDRYKAALKEIVGELFSHPQHDECWICILKNIAKESLK